MPLIKRLAIGFGCLAIVIILLNANAQNLRAKASLGQGRIVAQAPTPTPGFIPWYYPSPSPWPDPVASGYAAIGGAMGVRWIYNDFASIGIPSGLAMLGTTNACNFICFGAPGAQSHHVLAYGNDVDSTNDTSYTTQGAPDDCNKGGHLLCPGGVPNAVFSVTLHTSPAPTNSGYYVSLDGNANFAVYGNVIAGSAIVAGAGDTDPGVTSGITSLSGGVRPNGTSGGYAPEAFPVGSPTPHPQIMSGSCFSTSSPILCSFPNSFSFSNATSYYCTISAIGTVATSDSYARTSASSITVYASTAGGTFSYICLGS